MLLLTPIATIKDTVKLIPVGDASKIALEMEKVRQDIKKLTNQETLINEVQNGSPIMIKKISFDNYMKSHVQLMKAYVNNNIPCPFSYDGYFTSSPITTDKLSIKQQWALQIIMIRLNICSIYQVGAYSSLQVLYNSAADTYVPNYKEGEKFINHLKIIYNYFFQGYDPLRRLSEVFPSIQKLLTPTSKQIPQLNKDLFVILKQLMEINLAMLKIEKYRILCQFKNCKESSYAAFLKIKQILVKISKYSSINLNTDILTFIKIGAVFFKLYSLYFLIEQNQFIKKTQDYGFIEKKFQSMLLDNISIINEMERLYQVFKNIKDIQSNGYGHFAKKIVAIMMQEAAKYKYKFSINIHENKSNVPEIDDVLTRRIVVKDIWQSINQF